MNNLILKSVSASNFASFAEQVDFTTEIDSSKKDFQENTFEWSDAVYNKVSYIYGANGSGKTFFCKIVREIQRLLEWSPLTAMSNLSEQFLSMSHYKNLDRAVSPFMFDEDLVELPTNFKIEIIIGKVTYKYEFSILGRKVVYELLTKKYRRTEVLIERTSPANKDIKLRSELKSFEATKQVVKEEALCLPVAALLNNKLAIEVVTAISEIQVINMAAARLKPMKSNESFTKDRIAKYLEILKQADPTIREMNISLEEKEIERVKADINDFENREIITKRTLVDVETKHASFKNGQETRNKELDFFDDESLGTIKLFTALPYLFDVLEDGGVLIIDEIENGLHLSLTKEIIGLFQSEASNPYHAQLICTSHQPLLVEGDVRRDQVWVMSKDIYGRCKICRISELKTSRAKFNISSRLIEGALGCNPERFFPRNM